MNFLISNFLYLALAAAMGFCGQIELSKSSYEFNQLAQNQALDSN